MGKRYWGCLCERIGVRVRLPADASCSSVHEADGTMRRRCQAAIKNLPGRRIRTDFSDWDSAWEEQFYILRKSWCPAVLTENFFMDSISDLEYLQSRAGKQAVVDTHVEGIVEYLESK